VVAANVPAATVPVAATVAAANALAAANVPAAAADGIFVPCESISCYNFAIKKGFVSFYNAAIVSTQWQLNNRATVSYFFS
jgi:hypothetical protein